jgi:glycine/D-amino acid oxidase-like deaminating enzyme
MVGPLGARVPREIPGIFHRNTLDATSRTQIVADVNTPVWDDGNWAPLPRLEGGVRADVCVVGLGGSGLAALEELVAQGINAVGVDARAVGAGAAGRNGGFVLAGLAKFYHETAANLGRENAAAIYRATLEEIARLAAENPGAVRLDGSLRLAADAAELEDCRAHLAALRADGFAAEWYRGPEGEGLLLPTDGVFQPLRVARTQARRLRERGILLYEASPVRKIVPGSVVTDAGTIYCDSVIMAVDGQLEAQLPELAGRVRSARLQMLATAPVASGRFPRPVYWRYGYEYWQQLPDGRLAVGGFRDKFVEQEWTRDDQPSDQVQAMIEGFLREHLKVNAAITHRWAASVGYTGDGLPVLEQVRPKLWACGGYNGTGNIVGRLSGRAAAQQVCGATGEWPRILAQARGG